LRREYPGAEQRKESVSTCGVTKFASRGILSNRAALAKRKLDNKRLREMAVTCPRPHSIKKPVEAAGASTGDLIWQWPFREIPSGPLLPEFSRGSWRPA
jgi:hypothetical protein